ncbi:Predicted dehydrogenase [Selenomonas ruminantium]|uniref:Predicted dehydrogenase n=1 Tax=Selenomonas ruminantium TaxID=971 RepID=A0A1M6VGP3_SELRU|nr:Gfo/Idh/MocA family oxidoreductase [Selenomonas ruminantium]SHK80717.1 Predicted dehydrogenase [Selenomonas ruminantium]
MHKQQELVISYIGNGKSTNRYHLPFALNRPEKIKVKTVYQRTLGKGSWTPVAGITYTDNLSEMLADQEIQAVIICTPVGSHKSLVEQVLKAGKHCVVEKPFALNLKDAEDMFRLAEEKDLILECYQNRRFDSDFLTTQQVIESGRLGQLFEVNMNYDYYRPQVPEGEKNYRQDQAFLYTHACHTVDQVLSYFGQPQDVRCDVRQLLGKGRMNDYFDLDFYYDGLKVSVKSSYFRAKARPSFAVYGTRGVFIKETEDRQEADLKKFYLPAGHEDFGQDLPEHYGTLIYYDDAGLYHEEKVPTITGDYARYYDALYETILNGAPPLVTKEQTLTQMKILEQAGENLS